MVDTLTGMSNTTLLYYYESIRDQIAADRMAPCGLMGDSAKAYAGALLAEIRRRGLNVEPIDWPHERIS
jgi:hypothetical protein